MEPTQYKSYGADASAHNLTLRENSLLHSFSALYAGTNAHLYEIFMRVFNIIFSLLLSLILLISLPFIWLANLVFDRGPLFYKQQRVGKNGRIFTMYKLRSMVMDAEAKGMRFTSVNDERITRVGAFLRKTRLDELPQVINVIKGEMSIIGPRPERPQFVEILSERDTNYHFRHLVRPGITGWAQVKYGYTDNIDDGLIKLNYDLYYIANRNLKIDMEILATTVFIVVGRKGT